MYSALLATRSSHGSKNPIAEDVLNNKIDSSLGLPPLVPLQNKKVSILKSTAVNIEMPPPNIYDHSPVATKKMLEGYLASPQESFQLSKCSSKLPPVLGLSKNQEPPSLKQITMKLSELIEREDNVACRELLGSEGIKIDDIRTKKGNTLLTYYACKGDIKKVEMLLLDLGSNIYANNRDGTNAFEAVLKELERLILSSNYQKEQLIKVQAVEMFLAQYMALKSYSIDINLNNFKRTT